MTKLSVFSDQNLMIAVNSFSLYIIHVQSCLLYGAAVLTCCVLVWTEHLVDFPATIANTVDIGLLCLDSKKKEKKRRTFRPPAPVFKFVWGQTNIYFVCLMDKSLNTGGGGHLQFVNVVTRQQR